MFAGVGSNAGADTNTKDGIAFGHAYGLVNVYEGEGERLVQLKNPWGKGSEEWSGDWSDESDKWTQKWKKRLGVTGAREADGKFWMSFDDFLVYFRFSICF